MRWDFYLSDIQEWVALGPTCVPEKLKDLLSKENAQELIEFYRTYVCEAQIWNQLRSLQAILATQSFLKINNIKNIQTYMDRDLFVAPARPKVEHYNAVKDPSWPQITSELDLETLPNYIKTEITQSYQSMVDPDYIQVLQKITYNEMQDFEGQTFLEWSRLRGYEVTKILDHPLEQAHQAAADLWRPKYQQQLQ
jgi:hypothetical protein